MIRREVIKARELILGHRRKPRNGSSTDVSMEPCTLSDHIDPTNNDVVLGSGVLIHRVPIGPLIRRWFCGRQLRYLDVEQFPVDLKVELIRTHF